MSDEFELSLTYIASTASQQVTDQVGFRLVYFLGRGWSEWALHVSISIASSDVHVHIASSPPLPGALGEDGRGTLVWSWIGMATGTGHVVGTKPTQ